MKKNRFQVEKKGLIYSPDNVNQWMRHTVITPAPFLVSPEIIRVYAGFMDDKGISRLGFIDLDASNPTNILGLSKQPILELGQPGTFDDNGMILGDIIHVQDRLRLYYVGFQIPQKAKFLAFSGVAESISGDEFKKIYSVPVMDRSPQGPYIRAIHTVLRESDKYRVWYSVGDGWQVIEGKSYPKYYICYAESMDGLNFDRMIDHPCILPGPNEYRIGRPKVFKLGDQYHMLFTYDTLDKQYHVGYAFSKNGVEWVRDDTAFPLFRSDQGWDSEMVCYPVPLFWKDKIYLFYSGNDMGRTGVGYAELLEDS